MSVSPESLIGKTITVGTYKVVVKKRIGEGGYAWVFRAVDASGNQYALKWVNCLTPERFEQFKQEAAILKSIPEHPNIVKLYASQENPKAYVVALLYEYCPMTAIGILQKRAMTRDEILIFFTACAEATAFLHSQNPPIIPLNAHGSITSNVCGITRSSRMRPLKASARSALRFVSSGIFTVHLVRAENANPQITSTSGGMVTSVCPAATNRSSLRSLVSKSPFSKTKLGLVDFTKNLLN